MHIIPEVFYPLLLGLFYLAIYFFKKPRYAIAGFIISKPLIDVFYNYYIILDINFLKLYAGLFAILGVVYIIRNHLNIFKSPLSRLWFAFLVINFISTFLINQDLLLLARLRIFLSLLNGFVAFILFAELFKYPEDRKLVLLIFILAGLAPVIFWFSQILSPNPYISVAGVHDELQRMRGPYASFTNYRFYGLQLLISSLTLLALISPQSIKRRLTSFKTLGLSALFIASILLIYKSYSKSAWIILPLCLIIWFLLRKRTIPLLITISLVLGFFTMNPFSRQAKSLFQKEVDTIVLKNNQWSEDTLFMGRYRRWKAGMQDFEVVTTAQKLLGMKKNNHSPENEYLKVLWSNGIIGLIIYLFLLYQIAYQLIIRYNKNKDPIYLAGILIFIMFILSNIGSSLMNSPNSQWFIWGLWGYLLHRNPKTQ